MSKYKLFKNKWLYGVLAIILAFCCYYFVPADKHPQAPIMAAIVVLMAVFWIF